MVLRTIHNALNRLGLPLFRGVGLLRQTLWSNFQVSAPYYAEVDFHGFEKIIDTFGGVNVDPPYPIVDDEYPTERKIGRGKPISASTIYF